MLEPLSVVRSAGIEYGDLIHTVGIVDLAKVRVVPAPRWMLRFWARGVAAMTVRNRIFMDPELVPAHPHERAALVIHELVHVRQWAQLGAVRFLASYVAGYLSGRLGGLDHRTAYVEIHLEREARLIQERLTPREHR